jgi:gamma-glutamyltranspeptidase / glutathione hydrolase
MSGALPAGIAAGHPATVEAGIEILEAGGTAADVAAAASLASCVAETLMTGLLGGGHAIYWDARTGRARNLDCFVAVPGLGAEPREPELIKLDVPFGAELVHYAVGPASCGVPGLPAGLGTLWREHGRLPWPRVVEPALRLAHAGTTLPPAHAACLAMLEPVMTMNEGAGIYAPEGRLLQNGELVRQPDLPAALEALATEGAESAYTGTIADGLLGLMAERGGTVTRRDLLAYEPRWSEPAEVDYCGMRFLTRADLSGLPETLTRLPRLRTLDEMARTLALVDVLVGEGVESHTTNLVVADREGSACVLTTSLGLGSGDWIPGLDLHLNSMLGEVDLLRGTLRTGERMHSMMAPSLAIDTSGQPALAAGAAGGTRLRTALVGVVAGVLDEGRSAQEAVARPRFHPAGRTLNVEPGVDEGALAALEGRGWSVRRWPAPHHYFGGVSVITSTGAAGDPRRSGSARLLG